jgi:hypothetical protein
LSTDWLKKMAVRFPAAGARQDQMSRIAIPARRVIAMLLISRPDSGTAVSLQIDGNDLMALCQHWN